MSTHEIAGSTERQTGTWTPKRLRLAGLAAMLGGALSAAYPVGEFLFEFGPQGTPGYETYLLFITPLPVLLVLLLVGVLGLYAYAKDTYALGWMARVGIAVLAAGYGLEIVGNLIEVWVAGANPAAVLGGNTHLLTLFGILMELVGASLLAVALPAGIGGAVALVLAGLDAALFFAFTVPIGTALVILGYHLRSAATETSAEPSPTSEKEIQTE